MNAQRLFVQSAEGVFCPVPHRLCAKCGACHPDRASAEACCRCGICGQEVRGETYHPACVEREVEAGKERRRARAKIVPYAGGPLYVEEWGTFYEDAAAFRATARTRADVPPYAYPCRAEAFRGLTVDEVLREVEDRVQGGFEPVKAVEALEGALRAFNAANAQTRAYRPVYDRKVECAELLRMDPAPGVGRNAPGGAG